MFRMYKKVGNTDICTGYTQLRMLTMDGTSRAPSHQAEARVLVVSRARGSTAAHGTPLTIFRGVSTPPPYEPSCFVSSVEERRVQRTRDDRSPGTTTWTRSLASRPEQPGRFLPFRAVFVWADKVIIQLLNARQFLCHFVNFLFICFNVSLRHCYTLLNLPKVPLHALQSCLELQYLRLEPTGRCLAVPRCGPRGEVFRFNCRVLGDDEGGAGCAGCAGGASGRNGP